ncbi:histidine kinase dimerization/phospho-acceptor domain-containing protein [Bdellovibrio sp. HCB274]|uniref:HAMP domain-containing sensor histidine kinase n=1 Tax=Bdellovibrio sp. HCB274 TaxID=3394361 RepID=UPI0039B6698B
MITRRSLLGRNYFIFVSIIIVFIFMAFGSTWLVAYLDRSTPVRYVRPPNYLLRNLYEQLDSDPIVAFQKLQASNNSDNFLRFELVDKSGKSLINGDPVLPRGLTEAETNSLLQDKSVRFGEMEFGPPKLEVSKTKFPGVYFVHRFLPPPGFGMPPPPSAMGAPPPPRSGPGGPGMGGPGGPPPLMSRKNPMFITFGFLIVFTLVSVAVALIYQFSRYRDRANEAFQVLNELRHGNLSARLPTKKVEELAPLVQAFNQMADDVESMVESLRKADQARRQLLQDLAHDLRTPLASLQSFLETLQVGESRLSSEKRQEIVSLCFSEVEYFGKLVEDLLFLAQITEPKYSAGTEEINLLERVQDQVTVFKNRYPNLRFKIDSTLDASNSRIMGSSKLVDRLLRNAFENSASFAKNEIQVSIANNGAKLQLAITDDGPGFSEAALREFGHKKASRILSDGSSGKRISVGIGSVIMREIIQLHGGELKAENVVALTNNNGSHGGRVSFWFPKS